MLNNYLYTGRIDIIAGIIHTPFSTRVSFSCVSTDIGDLNRKLLKEFPKGFTRIIIDSQTRWVS